MSKSETIETIRTGKIIPVIRANSRAEAEETIENIIAAGIKIVEITMTTPDAIDLIEKFSGEFSGAITVGAGTVLDVETAERCEAAGARFIVSPVVAPEIVAFCSLISAVSVCGALSPTEIFAASRAGADFVKVFPANAAGGASYIKSIKAVFPHIRIMPTGGITLEKAADFLAAGAEAVGIGSGLNDLTAEAIENFRRRD